MVVPLRPELVVEASADHITYRHFRHGARILRWPSEYGMGKLDLAKVWPAAR